MIEERTPGDWPEDDGPDDGWGEDDGYPATPRRGDPRLGSGAPARSWGGQLREAAADRLPIALRARQPPDPARAVVPIRAVVVVLLIAAGLGVVLLAGSRSGDASTTVPARSSPARYYPAQRSSSAPGTGTPPLPPPPGAPGGLPVGAVGLQVNPGTGSPSGGTAAAAGQVVVDVTGRVHRPGLVRLLPGSRVWDAVLGAGGVTYGARLDRLNLARLLTDGEQILVPGPNDPVAVPAGPGGGPPSALSGTGAPSAAAHSPGAPVDLNSATPSDLDGLPGVGPVLAGRIVAWRTQHGRFSRVEELGEVKGIGVKLFATLRPLVRV